MITIKRKREKIFYFLLIPSSVVVFTFILILSVLVYNSIPAYEKEGLSIYTKNIWNPVSDLYGGLAAIYGTIVTGVLSVMISIPFATALAIFVNDISPKKVKSFLVNLSDLLAAFPTVLYGFWGLLSLGPFLSRTLFTFLSSNHGLHQTTNGPSILLASIILAIMITPFASSLIREVYSQVPRSFEEAVYSLGLGKWELIMLKLSYIKKAFLGAYALAFGKAVGETVAVSLTIGNVLNISPNLLEPGYTIPSLIISQFGTAYGIQYNVMFALALFLVVIGFIFIMISKLILRVRS
ncbi:phosphate ABC transporter permease subunit PstC [Stygiolobus sp. RP850M]|uniref:phosphate ABC transporter permease subunit PstC n=1 Tax=Stygiolobus sp. RP850M TaxID=3133137 RepID=UPI00307F8A7B